MTPAQSVVLPVAAYAAALAGAYLLMSRLARLMLRARLFDGCYTCHLLGRIPGGPPYWLLRWHLRRAVPRTDEADRELL